jgi:hypothetical protein
VANDSLQETLTREEYIRVFDGESALRFDGAGSARCQATSALELGAQFTVEAYVRPPDATTTEIRTGRIMDKGAISLLSISSSGSYHDRSLLLQLTNDEGVTFRANTPENSLRFDDTWQHVAAAYDASGDVRVYVDGVRMPLTGTLPSDTLAENGDTDLVLASSLNQGSGLAGGLDEVRIWGVCRSEAEIQEAMHRHLTGHEPGLRGCWRMNEGNGDTLVDAADEGLIAQVAGAEWIQGVALDPAGSDPAVIPGPTHHRILRSAAPNPFSASVGIFLELATPTPLHVAVYDLEGRRVTTLAHGKLEPGMHRVEWDGCDAEGARVGQGHYLIRLKGPGVSEQSLVLRVEPR